VPGAPAGPLVGESVAVKDLFAVAGQKVGAGNPTWEAAAPVERSDATVADTLVEAGASLRGIARTDEFAYSLAGVNAHHGAPPNPRAPRRAPRPPSPSGTPRSASGPTRVARSGCRRRTRA
jgi:Asp-tRNA(Asn)/Glu-tRNA(Gln) amidotransferase A subunit family amidase